MRENGTSAFGGNWAQFRSKASQPWTIRLTRTRRDVLLASLLVSTSLAELEPSPRDRWVRLLFPWGLISSLSLAAFLLSTNWWFVIPTIGVSAWGLYEFSTPAKLKMDSWALEVTHLGRTRKLPWRNVAYALPGLIFRGEVVRIFLNQTGRANLRRFTVVLRYGFGHNSDALVSLINNTRAAAVPDEPHPLPEEKRRQIDRALMIGFPIFVALMACLFYAIGVFP
jgi:hypothetical protein